MLAKPGKPWLNSPTFSSLESITSTVTLGVDSLETFSGRFVAAMNGEPQGAYITFASADLLFETLTQRRWNILRLMIGVGSLSLRELARRAGYSTQTVQRDAAALLNVVGVLECNADGTIDFPYDAVHVDFMLTANWFPWPAHLMAARSQNSRPRNFGSCRVRKRSVAVAGHRILHVCRVSCPALSAHKFLCERFQKPRISARSDDGCRLLVEYLRRGLEQEADQLIDPGDDQLNVVPHPRRAPSAPANHRCGHADPDTKTTFAPFFWM